jgi:NTP pyrophosphatase (non-canonical NTP hydrolase)
MNMGQGTAVSGQKARLLNVALGLVGEAGELVEMIKKTVYHGHVYELAEWEEEIGDGLFYYAFLCTVLGIDLAAVMVGNVAKLTDRYPNGFSQKDSVNRKENKGGDA